MCRGREIGVNFGEALAAGALEHLLREGRSTAHTKSDAVQKRLMEARNSVSKALTESQLARAESQADRIAFA